MGALLCSSEAAAVQFTRKGTGQADNEGTGALETMSMGNAFGWFGSLERARKQMHAPRMFLGESQCACVGWKAMSMPLALQ